VAVQVINSDALVVFAGAVKEVAGENLKSYEVIVAVAVTVAVMLVPYYAPALAYAIWPNGSRRVISPVNNWILDHLKLLEVVVGLLFGAIFLDKGISGLS
jgi:asparagine N-glycosylation enzyme membrane subunit Stt3